MGLKCNFTPYSFYLGGNRTYLGLPNNPDYDLPGDSACIYANLTPGPSPHGEGRIQCTYISAWEKLFVNASRLNGKNVTVSVYDGRGSLMFEVQSLKSNAGYFTLDVDCGGWSDGLYIVNLNTEKEMLGTKFIKN
ncbi:MAG: T9SS type A sorting domain-containing protein [Bacteroidetes bacterium]|nr:T9SS type A sorting domain-containing protein [Bacteroidota bacterium]